MGTRTKQKEIRKKVVLPKIPKLQPITTPLITFDFHDGERIRKEDAYNLVLRFTSGLSEDLNNKIALMFQAQSISDELTEEQKKQKEEAEAKLSPDELKEREREDMVMVRSAATATIDVLRHFRQMLNIKPFAWNDQTQKAEGLTDSQLLGVFYQFQEFLHAKKNNIENEQ